MTRTWDPKRPFKCLNCKTSYLTFFALQDTAVPTDLPWLNMVQGPNGAAPTYHSCWRDMYYDLEAAEHIITITGWSVWTELR